MAIETNKKKLVLVTGASGYLSGNLCRALLRDGHSVRAFVRPTSRLPSVDDAGPLEVAYGDVTDYPSLLAACSGCDVIFHSAALVEPWLPDPSRFFSVNVGGLKNILRAFEEAKTPQKIIYTSSFFALGQLMEYEKSKAAADKIALQAAADGLPIVLLYPGAIYGPGKLTSGNTIAQMMIERFSGQLPGYIGYGTDRVSFSLVEDVVSGHVAAMHQGRVGERYLLTGENASLKHAFDIAAIITETRRPLFHIPLWMIEIYGWLSVLLVARITGKLPLISHPAAYVLRHQWAYSCEKARAELGYNPRSLKEGLEEILPWLKSSGLIKY
ncbi:hypothetical protein AAC387_Pa11g1469 [Persea americana]